MCKLAGECYVQLQDFDKALQARAKGGGVGESSGSRRVSTRRCSGHVEYAVKALQAALGFEGREEDPALYIRLGASHTGKIKDFKRVGCGVESELFR